MNTILAVGRVVGGSVHLHVTPPALLMPDVELLPWEPVEVASDGTLQAMIDFADEETLWYEARLEELRDAMDDEEWHARGGW